MADKVINLFGNLTALTIDQLDKALSDEFVTGVDWDNPPQCFFNLSQVRFSQLQTVAKLTLKIARCMENTQSEVLVALPTIGLSEKEKRSFNSKPIGAQDWITKHAESRKRANSFIKTLKFDKVLVEIAQTIPGASVSFTESFGYASAFTDNELERAIQSAFNGKPLATVLRNTSKYKCIYPLTWIECRNEGSSEFQWNEQIFDSGGPGSGATFSEV